ncbi:Uncharacterised protein [Moraxella lacunata]|uniref:Uncharacterized protein n=1 Tax=Moraxella lacunata TaxID=477 RepID=A0A378QJ75_MORLA|nr:Uncharacterised protein [Moraxella lacunata]
MTHACHKVYYKNLQKAIDKYGLIFYYFMVNDD